MEAEIGLLLILSMSLFALCYLIPFAVIGWTNMRYYRRKLKELENRQS